MAFSVQKEMRLKKEDLSRKGSIDTKIIDLVEYINAQPYYVSTSSCSGRTAVFINSVTGKKDLQWIFLSHDIINPQNVIEALKSHSGSAVLKFEPFVLHVQCKTLEYGQKLQALGIASGFKNSGLSIGRKGKIIVAIRSSLSLETPLSCNGVLMVCEEYISYVVSGCNEKMKENWHRIDRFFNGLKKIIIDLNEKPKMKKTTEKFPKNHSKPFSETNNEDSEQYTSIQAFYDIFNNGTDYDCESLQGSKKSLDAYKNNS